MTATVAWHSRAAFSNAINGHTDVFTVPPGNYNPPATGTPVLYLSYAWKGGDTSINSHSVQLLYGDSTSDSFNLIGGGGTDRGAGGRFWNGPSDIWTSVNSGFTVRLTTHGIGNTPPEVGAIVGMLLLFDEPQPSFSRNITEVASPSLGGVSGSLARVTFPAALIFSGYARFAVGFIAEWVSPEVNVATTPPVIGGSHWTTIESVEVNDGRIFGGLNDIGDAVASLSLWQPPTEIETAVPYTIPLMDSFISRWAVNLWTDSSYLLAHGRHSFGQVVG